VTAVFAASIAVAQNDIKRILAYSTVSQLGYMMMGLGVGGGVAVGMFHLTTHAFFKALLFLGAGSVIHGCHEEQDIRHMGGLRTRMRLTFATYAVGMMALCGVPLFSGFWSKDAILDAAHEWSISQIPFYLGLFGAFLTAFYMTRQVCLVFFGKPATEAAEQAHESPRVMTVPLLILACLAVVAGLFGTPVWPWFQTYLNDVKAGFHWSVMLVSSGLVAFAIVLSGWIYGRASRAADPLQTAQPAIFACLQRKFFVDEFYDATFVRLNAAFAKFSDWLDRAVWGGLVRLLCWLTLVLARLSRGTDESVVNGGFDAGTETVRASGKVMSLLQNGQAQRYLRIIGLAFCGLLLLLLWGCR
jgi:NADH-quinone oxidoreductase subunit L